MGSVWTEALAPFGDEEALVQRPQSAWSCAAVSAIL